MIKVLVFIDWYRPAYKAGGPISSVENLTDLIGDEISFYIVTSDNDLNNEPLKDIIYDSWVKLNKVHVRYLRENQEKRDTLKQIVNEINPDKIYINGIFSKFYSVWPLFLFRKKYNLIISPRGMLINEALKIKFLKKKCFLMAMRLLGVYKNVYWHFSNKVEFNQAKNHAVINQNKIIPNLSRKIDFKEEESNAFRIISVCRINKIKNIHFFLNVLQKCNFQCEYFIVGIIEDKLYYRKLLEAVEKLPIHISVQFLGAKSYGSIKDLLQHSTLFVSTSLNENYGHSIAEALGHGVPVLISESCPWEKLELFQAGFRIPMNEKNFIEKLNEIFNKSKQEHKQMSRGARTYYEKYIDPAIFKNDYIQLFNE